MVPMLTFEVATASPGVWVAQYQPPGSRPVKGSGLTEAAALVDLRGRVAEHFGIPTNRVMLVKAEEVNW